MTLVFDVCYQPVWARTQSALHGDPQVRSISSVPDTMQLCTHSSALGLSC